ncbi:MAG: hypothetical protein K9G24_01725 [Candidatus Nanopelagicales bacterium]|nr:hypothetical protein [Candidatus Nanopelagicales bacterium]MCF8536795.1 hypothetical protein [Candidatus Nanopelagicales bacterium]MCF8541780.1 hypothetical protein [Candidatus Nanopelagicales bacterium]
MDDRVVQDRSGLPAARRGWLVGAGILAAAGWMVFRAGVTVTPSLADIVASATVWPERLDGEFRGFYADSPLGLLLFRALGLQTNGGMLVAATAITAVVIIGYAGWAAMAASTGDRARATRLALLAPLPAVLLAWLGSYDAFTMLAWLICLYLWWTGSRLALVSGGILLGFQHFEHTLLGGVVLVLVWAATRDRIPDRLAALTPGWLIVGMLVGKGLLLTVLVASGSTASGRTEWLAPYLRDWTVTGINVLPMLIWSLFAGSWAVVIAFWASAPQRRTRYLMLAAAAVALTATALSGDRPRVFVIVCGSAMLLLIVAYLNAPKHSDRELRLVEAVVWLAPPIALWGKEVVGANVVDQLIIAWQQLVG